VIKEAAKSGISGIHQEKYHKAANWPPCLPTDPSAWAYACSAFLAHTSSNILWISAMAAFCASRFSSMTCISVSAFRLTS
jgi:hypothetical protein